MASAQVGFVAVERRFIAVRVKGAAGRVLQFSVSGDWNRGYNSTRCPCRHCAWSVWVESRYRP